MNLYLHLSIHISFSLLAGFIVWKLWKKPVESFIFGVVGGFLVDLDHVIDYFLAFGWNIRFEYFAKGYEFLKSDKIFILLHGWEYVIILMFLAIFIFKNKTAKSVILALALGLFFHLGFDASANEGARFSTYSIANRIHKNFELKDLVTQEHYLDHQEKKKLIDFE